MGINLNSGFSKLLYNNRIQNNKIGFGKNGVLQNSSSVESHTNPEHEKNYQDLAHNRAIINKAGLKVNRKDVYFKGFFSDNLTVGDFGLNKDDDDFYKVSKPADQYRPPSYSWSRDISIIKGSPIFDTNKLPDYVKKLKFVEFNQSYSITGSKHLDKISVHYAEDKYLKIQDKVNVGIISAVRGIKMGENASGDQVLTYGDFILTDNAQVNYVDVGSLKMYDNSIVDHGKIETYKHGDGSIRLCDNARIQKTLKLPDASKIEILSKNAYINPFLIESQTSFNPSQMRMKNGERYMPKTVYFDEDFTFKNDWEPNNVESKGNVYFSNKSKANNVASTKEVKLWGNSEVVKISANDATLLHDATTGEINARSKVHLQDNCKATKITANDVVLIHNATVDEINAKNEAHLESSTNANIVIANNIRMFHDAIATSVVSKSGSVGLYQNSKIGSLSSDQNINLTGHGHVENIQTKGNQVIITGPIRLKEKIKFEKDGIVIVKKNNDGQFAQINSSQVENGKLRFDMGNGLLGNAHDVFGAGITTTLAQRKQPVYKQNLGIYADAKSLRERVFSGFNVAVKLDKLSANGNEKKVERLYDGFVNDTLQTFVSPESKKYTTYWVTNKKLGDLNLTDFWLSSLGKDITSKKQADKRDMLNSLSLDEKTKLIDTTITYFVESVLPKALNKQNNADLSDLEQSLDYAHDFAQKMKGSEQETLSNLVKHGYNKLQSTEIGNKNLVDLWIDAVEGEGASQNYTQRLKQSKVSSLISDPKNVETIVNATVEKACKNKESIKTARDAYNDAIDNELELDESHKNLLKEYENSRLFFQVVTNKTNTTDLAGIEMNAISTTKDLVRQKKDIEKKTRENIFEPLSDIRKVYKNQDKPEMQDKVDFVFTILQGKINTAPDSEANKTKAKISQLQKETDENSPNIGNTWSELVSDAQKHYETHVLSEVTTKNIKLLHSMNNRLIGEKDETILGAIKDKSLDKIEQKEFIARYKDDNNFKIMLDNSGVHTREAIDGLLFIETVNKNIFKENSEQFREKLSLETVKTNKDMTDRYVSALGKDSSPMSAQEKLSFLSSIPPEELKLAGFTVYQNWKKEDLAKFMSEKFIEVDHENNINAQGKNIVGELKKVNTSLDKVNVNLDGQNHTLQEISQNIDKFADTYKETQAESNKHLIYMAEQLGSINQNTLSIKANTRAFLMNAMQSTKDPELRSEIMKLIPEVEQKPLSEFLKIVDDKNEKDRKKQIKGNIIRFGVGAIALAAVIYSGGLATPAVAGATTATGTAATAATTSHIIPFMTEIAKTCGSSMLGSVITAMASKNT
jgi:hypothetical protein